MLLPIYQIKHNKRGFTFIELLIALTIFALIALGIYSTFSTGLNTWRRSEESNRLQQEGRWALDRMAKELRNAVIYNYGLGYPDVSLFSGEKTKISFLSLIYNPTTKLSEIKRITYSTELPEYGEVHKTIMGEIEEKQSQTVVHYEEQTNPLTSLQRKEETLLQDLQLKENTSVKSEALTNLVKSDGLLFSYAFPPGTGEEEATVWKDNWEDRTKLPKGIKITLILQNPKNPTEEATFTKTVFLEQGEIIQSSEE